MQDFTFYDNTTPAFIAKSDRQAQSGSIGGKDVIVVWKEQFHFACRNIVDNLEPI